MIYPSNESMKKVGSKYKLVLMAAQRSKQLKAGMKPLIETESTNPLTIAFEEIAAGEVIGITPDIEEIDSRVLEDIAKNDDTQAVLDEEAAADEYEAKDGDMADTEDYEDRQEIPEADTDEEATSFLEKDIF
ncbi:MAG: DNA-directed RNA polymerase subunit omega [Abditibacteriota bacterium]|nr:DNA-directed RNA polymerase subunit omega [Abditibacteriota bacterium]